MFARTMDHHCCTATGSIIGNLGDFSGGAFDMLHINYAAPWPKACPQQGCIIS
jgi:hypothetical protein